IDNGDRGSRIAQTQGAFEVLGTYHDNRTARRPTTQSNVCGKVVHRRLRRVTYLSGFVALCKPDYACDRRTMAKPVKYNSPRRFNLVSIPLFAALGLFVYFAYQYVPLPFPKHEAFRILEETGSALIGH